MFAGTPAVAVPSLDTLASSHEIAWVVTRPDARLGRRRVLTPSPVAARAEHLGLRTLKTDRLDAAATSTLTREPSDLGVIVAYGALVREPLLSAPRLGWINLHFSLLPRWRGAAPVQHAIVAGDAETGAAVIRLVSELDAGDVLASERQPIGDETAGELLESLSESGAHLLADVVAELEAGTALARPQEGEVTLAPKLRREDGRIDWRQPTAIVARRIRGTTPEPGAFAMLGGLPVKVLEIELPRTAVADLRPGQLASQDGVVVGTGDGAVRLVTVQPAGKRAMPAASWFRGLPAGATEFS